MTPRVFKTRVFERWMQKIDLSDDLLLNAVDEMERGLIDADLGGGVFKKRIALPNRGKSGSVRTLIATNKNDRWFFMVGFEKNQRDNIGKIELIALKESAKTMLTMSEAKLDSVLKTHSLKEIHYEN
jgi:hypothetical protein